MIKTTTQEPKMTKKLASQVFAAWIARKHSGLYSVEEAAQATCAEFSLTRSQFTEVFRLAVTA